MTDRHGIDSLTFTDPGVQSPRDGSLRAYYSTRDGFAITYNSTSRLVSLKHKDQPRIVHVDVSRVREMTLTITPAAEPQARNVQASDLAAVAAAAVRSNNATTK